MTMIPRTSLRFLVFLIFLDGSIAFQSFQLPKFFQPGVSVSKPSQQQNEDSLLDTISNTQYGKTASIEKQRQVLKFIASLEKEYPPAPLQDILLNTPDKLDGTWYLQYTSPSELEFMEDEDDKDDVNTWKVENAEEKITTQKYNAKGSVSAGGINVDVSQKPPKQIFDIENSEVYNEVLLDSGFVRVGGEFRLSENKDNRAVVAFKFCQINLNFGVKLDLGFLFAIRALIFGTDESGWLETTYLSERVRIGRGNKGSMFILTRVESDVIP